MEIRDVCTPKKWVDKNKEEKTSWYKIGTAFIQEDGRISLDLAASPINGKCCIFKRKNKKEPELAF